MTRKKKEWASEGVNYLSLSFYLSIFSDTFIRLRVAHKPCELQWAIKSSKEANALPEYVFIKPFSLPLTPPSGPGGNKSRSKSLASRCESLKSSNEGYLTRGLDLLSSKLLLKYKLEIRKEKSGQCFSLNDKQRGKRSLLYLEEDLHEWDMER